MSIKKKLIVLVASIGILGVAGTAYAADFKSPAEIVAGLTGKTITDVTAERSNGKTYGTIAKEAGKLDQFKTEVLQQKKAILDERVQNGNMTQQQADTIYQNIENNQAACDGTGNPGIGCTNGGVGCGGMMGQGRGQGIGGGRCSGQGFVQGGNF